MSPVRVREAGYYLNYFMDNKNLIQVSDITLYLRCPRQVYFANRGYKLIPEITSSYLEHIFLKELALSYPKAIESKDLYLELNHEFERISEEIPIIYRIELSGISETLFDEVKSKIRNDLPLICDRISKSVQEIGKEQLLKQITPWELEYSMYSKKFGITGSPDKLIKISNEIIPAIIKTGNKPDTGVWKKDRLQLTSYAILIEEEFDVMVSRAFVEYSYFGDFRETNIKRQDRRKILQIRNKIYKIKEGVMPDKPKNAPCTFCSFTEMCEVNKSFASKFF